MASLSCPVPPTVHPDDRDPRRTDPSGPLVAEWGARAACRGVDAAVFFSPDKEGGPDRARREAEAKRLCASCPALAPCRDYAPAAPEPYGTWGGMSETEQRRYARQRRRAESLQ